MIMKTYKHARYVCQICKKEFGNEVKIKIPEGMQTLYLCDGCHIELSKIMRKAPSLKEEEFDNEVSKLVKLKRSE